MTPNEERPGRRRSKTAQRILKAAEACLRESLRGDVALREVAGRAGVSVGTIAYHYASKEQLFMACIDVYCGREAEALREARRQLERDGTSLRGVELLARSIYRFCWSERGLLALRTVQQNARGARVEHDSLVQGEMRRTARALAAVVGCLPCDGLAIVQTLLLLAECYVLYSEKDLKAVLAGEGSRVNVEEHLVECGRRVVARYDAR